MVTLTLNVQTKEGRKMFSGMGLGAIVAASAIIILFPSGAMADFKSVEACTISKPPKNCKGLWASTVSVAVSGTGARVVGEDPKCTPGQQKELNYSNLLGNAVKNVGDPNKFLNYTGDVFNMVQKDTVKEITQVIRGDVGAAITRNFGPTTKFANCAPLIVAIPQDAEVIGFRLEASDDKRGPCRIGEDCSISWSKFPQVPTEVTNDGVRAIASTFRNWSHNRTRVAYMTVFFRSAKPPITSM
jgi:hypothetical protein